MRLKIDHKLITTPIDVILTTARSELSNGKLKDIKNHGRNTLITCPCHKGGRESTPSCFVLNVDDDPKVEYGYAHCFTCGYAEPLPKVIADLFDKDLEFGKDWLCDRFCSTFVVEDELLPSIELSPKSNEPEFLDESILEQYDYYHPYMWERKLTKEVVDEFRVGYDHVRDAITFPVYDEKHRLKMVTARSVKTKRFYIPEGVDKPVYLLYNILERGMDTIFITEAQIDALTAMGWGYPCVATMGCPSKRQIDILNKSGIRSIIAIFDNDESGARFSLRLKKNLRKDILFDTFSWGGLNKKDINDFSPAEFDQEMQKQGFSCVKLK